MFPGAVGIGERRRGVDVQVEVHAAGDTVGVRGGGGRDARGAEVGVVALEAEEKTVGGGGHESLGCRAAGHNESAIRAGESRRHDGIVGGEACSHLELTQRCERSR
jgi:hypothetical protein